MTIVARDIGPVGGMERQLSELVAGLVRRGHAITVIARTCELPVGVEVDFHRVWAPPRPFLLSYPWFLLAGSLVLRRRRRGLVQGTGAVVLNRVDVVAVHYCQQVGPATASRPTALFRAHVKLAGALKRLAERVCFRINRSAAFVCVSRGVAEELSEHFPDVAERVVTIHNGVDGEAFAPGVRGERARAWRVALDIPRGRLVAAFVGGEWERKGLATVIRALALADWDLVVAGGGDRRHYQRLADSLGVGAKVRWLGVVRDMPLVYQLADAFVSASSYETFSLPAFEAAASGLPIVATAVSGVEELLQDGRNGFLVVPAPDAIAQRLALLAADPQLRSRLGRAARRAALAFGSERMVREHHVLYTRLAGASAGRRASARR